MPDSRPFEGRKLSRRERRAAAKRAAERADAMAKAMPPPERGDRVDPITGKPLYTPTGSHTRRPGAAPQPVPDTDAVSQARANGPASRPKTQAVRTGQRPVAPSRQLSEAEQTPRRRSLLKQQPDPADSASLPSLAEIAEKRNRPPVHRRVLAAVSAEQAGVNLVVGCVLTLAGLMVLVGLGFPVLNRTGWAWEPLLGGLLMMGVGAVLVYRGVPNATAKVKFPAVVFTAVLASAFVVGVAANPVIVDGRVLLNTSKEAKAARLADEIYRDLRKMAEYDVLLTADIADARSRVSEYDPAVKALAEVSDKYARMHADGLPDPLFAGVVDSMKTAAIWGSEAVKSKASLVAQEDSRTAADLETQRATFAQTWLTAANQLNEIGVALGIPVSNQLEGPHE